MREFYRKELTQRGYALKGGGLEDSETFEKNGGCCRCPPSPTPNPSTVAVSLVWLQ